jgi:GH35 family endo-1,4-beta-xylanase
MLRLAGFLVSACVALQLLAPVALAQTISGSSLSHRSSGSGTSNVTLSENGYVGTYFKLDAPGSVTLGVNASGSTRDPVLPRMNIVVADSKAGFDVTGGFNNYQQTFDLPAGTYLVRTEFANDIAWENRQLTISNLTISGASSVSNTTNAATNSANALAAANTYIENYRKGPANVVLAGAASGTNVRVRLKQHDFRFGTAVGGTFVGNGGSQYDVNTYLNNANYTSFLLNHFNTVTQGNAGKWASNESTRDVLTMQAVDRILQFAQTNGLNARMHNMLWGDSQQPTWVNTLLNNAAAGNQAAKDELRGEISERIDYYVGNGDGNPLDDRARRYQEMDLVNEHSHQAKYWNVYGANGIADIFNESAAAISAANSNAKLYLNEYNVFSWGDNYANWYRQDVDELRDQGGAIGGIGIQYYPSALTGSQGHNPARMFQTLQNLSVTGLDISLTEFGVSSANGTTVENAATYLEDTMRLVFGTPNATTFMMWGFWSNDVWDQAPLAALRDANWNPTWPGLKYDALMSEWNTDLTLPVAADGTIDFTGFYGSYEITIGGKKFDLDLSKGGASLFSLIVAPGDYDGNGLVDAADYVVWRDTLGSSVDFRADGNGDRLIDQNDYAIWKSTFGTSYIRGAGSTSFSVPEPSSATLLFLAATLSAWRFRQRAS